MSPSDPPAHRPQSDPTSLSGGRTYYQPPSRESGEGPGHEAGAIKDFLVRRRWTIVVGVVSVLAVVAGVTYLLPARYESTASFLIDRQQSSSPSAALAVLERLGEARSIETEVALIQGRRVVEPVVDRLDLHVELTGFDEYRRPPDIFSEFTAGRDAVPGSYAIRPSGNDYRVIDQEDGDTLVAGGAGTRLSFAGIQLVMPPAEAALEVNLEVSPFVAAVNGTQGRISAEPAESQADLVELTCQGPTAESAQQLCREIQRSYLDLRSSLRRVEASAAADFLEEQSERVRLQLTAAEDTLQLYQEQNRAIALEEQANQGVAQYASLQARQRELIAERNALLSLVEGIESGEPEVGAYRRLASFPTFLQNNDNIVSQLVESLVQVENRRSDLAVRRSDEDPELAAIDERIRDIETQLRQNAESYLSSLTAQIESLNQTLADQSQDLATMPEQQVESARLERRVTVLEDLYSFLQTRLQEAEVAEAVTLPSVRVVDDPLLPNAPSFPNVPLNLALGTILGLGVGLAGALWREYTDRKVRDRRELDDRGIPVLTMVPRLKERMFVRSGSDRQRAGMLVLSEKASEDLVQAAGEAFRTLAFELETAGRYLFEDVRSVAVTSAGRADGKTFCATNLAIQSSLMGKRTLLVDADLRARGVGRWFNIPSKERGLGELVREESDPHEVIVTVEVSDGLNLDVLPSGTESGMSSRLLTGPLQRVMGQIASRYDMVVVDTPPLNVLSDAAQVAMAVDGVICVVRVGVTERRGLDLALERLERSDGRVLGLVLNEVELPEYYTSYSRR